MKHKEVFISLGSNLGDRLTNLESAMQAIQANVGVVIRKSSIYETKPWGNVDQPDFFNQVIMIHTDKPAKDCLSLLLTIEKQMGRKREERWGARIIDLDLLYSDGDIIKTEQLTLPHPAIPQRRFVLVPLVEIASDFIHPELKINQGQLLADCPDRLDVMVLKT